jgi:hypothetical protein
MQVQRVAADATLEATGAHGALLQKSGREAAFAECRESADGVVAEHDHGVRQVDFECSCLEGEGAGEGLAPVLVTHVLGVR